MTTSCKIPYVSIANAPSPVRAALSKMPMRRHIFLLLSHSPGLFPPIMNVYSAFFSKETRTLPLLDWQLIVLRIAARLECEYEWEVNAPVAKVHGMSEEVMDTVGACKDVGVPGDSADVDDGMDGFLSKRQWLILRLVDEQLDSYTNRNATMKAVLDCLSPAELVETIIVIGFYVMIARLIKAVGIDEDAEIPGLEDMIKAGVT